VLERKNATLSKASRALVIKDYLYEPPIIPVKRSFYHDRVKQGATIVPRSVWFVDFEVQPSLGMIDVNKPMVKTSEEVKADAKRPWTDVELKGNVESEFIYATILGGDLVPFGYRKMRPIVVPAEPSAAGYSLLDVQALRNRGAVHMASWLDKAQSLWERFATERSKRDFPRIIDWLDYRGKLTQQHPKRRYVVLYNTSGTNLVSCVVSRGALPAFKVGGAEIYPNNFIAESTTYHYETDDEVEAHYLCAVLNSAVANTAIKPLQPRGLWGERHIHRRPFLLPIPRYDEANPQHRRLAELSMKCHLKVAKLMLGDKIPARARQEARETVSEELKEIDTIVYTLFGYK